MLQSIDNIYYTAINFIPFWNNSTYNGMMNSDGGNGGGGDGDDVRGECIMLCWWWMWRVMAKDLKPQAHATKKLLFTIRLISFITSHL